MPAALPGACWTTGQRAPGPSSRRPSWASPATAHAARPRCRAASGWPLTMPCWPPARPTPPGSRRRRRRRATARRGCSSLPPSGNRWGAPRVPAGLPFCCGCTAGTEIGLQRGPEPGHAVPRSPQIEAAQAVVVVGGGSVGVEVASQVAEAFPGKKVACLGRLAWAGLQPCQCPTPSLARLCPCPAALRPTLQCCAMGLDAPCLPASPPAGHPRVRRRPAGAPGCPGAGVCGAVAGEARRGGPDARAHQVGARCQAASACSTGAHLCQLPRLTAGPLSRRPAPRAPRSDWGGLGDGLPAAATLRTQSGRELRGLVIKCVGARPATATYASSLSAEQLGANGALAVEPTLQARLRRWRCSACPCVLGCGRSAALAGAASRAGLPTVEALPLAQVIGWRNVFAAGDVTNTLEEKTAALAGLAGVLVRCSRLARMWLVHWRRQPWLQLRLSWCCVVCVPPCLPLPLLLQRGWRPRTFCSWTRASSCSGTQSVSFCCNSRWEGAAAGRWHRIAARRLLTPLPLPAPRRPVWRAGASHGRLHAGQQGGGLPDGV